MSPSPTVRTRPASGAPLAAARGFAYALGTVTPILLARRLPTDQFGEYRDVLLLSMTLVEVLPLALPQSLFFFLPTRDPRRGSAVTQAVILLGIIGAAVGVLFAIGGSVTSTLFQVHDLEQVSGLLGLYLAGAILGAAIDSILLAEGRVKLASLLTVASELARSSLLIATALLGPTLPRLVAVLVVVALLRVVLLAYVSYPYFRTSRWLDPSLLREQAAFCAPFALAVVLSTAANSMDKYYVSLSMGPAFFAIYSIGVTQIPFMDVFFNAASDVLLPAMRRARESGDRAGMVEMWRGFVVSASSFVLPTMALLLVLSGTLITTLYGSKYAASGPIFALFVLQLPRYIVPYGSIPRAYGDTGFVLRANIVSLIVSIPALFLGLHFFGLPGAAAGSVIAHYAVTIPQVIRGTVLAGVRLGELMPWNHLARVTGVSAASAGVGLIVEAVTRLSGVPHLVVVGAVFGIAYLAIGWRLDVIPFNRFGLSAANGYGVIRVKKYLSFGRRS